MNTNTNTNTEAPKVTFRKTRNGEWAVFGPRDYLVKMVATKADIIREEEDAYKDEGFEAPRVAITKKNGETVYKLVRFVTKGFDVDGVEHAYGFIWEAGDRAEIITRTLNSAPITRNKGGRTMTNIAIDGIRYTLTEALAIDWTKFEDKHVFIDVPNPWDELARKVVAAAEAAGIEVR